METHVKKIIEYEYDKEYQLVKETHKVAEEQPGALDTYSNVEAWVSSEHGQVDTWLAKGYQIVKDKVYAKNVLMVLFKKEEAT